MRPSLSSSLGQGSAVGMVQSDAVALQAFRRVKKYQTAQIVALGLAFVFSTAACLTLSYVNFTLSPDCLLFATWTGLVQEPNKGTLPRQSPTPNPNANETERLSSGFSKSLTSDGIILNENTKWGKKKHCYLTQYGYAAAAACSFILCWFFVFFRPTKEAYLYRKKTAASKLIIPGIVFCLAFTICVFVAVITLEMGVVSWCNSVSSIKSTNGSPLGSCSAVQKYSLSNTSRDPIVVNYYSILLAGQIFAILGAVGWLASLVTLTVRCFKHVDFPDYFFEHSALSNDGFNTDTDGD